MDGVSNTASLEANAARQARRKKLSTESKARAMARAKYGTLFNAVVTSDDGPVQRLIAKSADVNKIYPSGQTALMKAASKSHGGVVKLLLSAGADVNSKKRDLIPTSPLGCKENKFEATDSFLKLSSKLQLPTDIHELRAMHQQTVPCQMQEFLRTFENGTEISFEHFVSGIREFSEFANLDFKNRQRLFKNGYLGLHYNNDLSKEWNKRHSDPIKALQLNFLCPQGWDDVHEDGYIAFLYKGRTPAKALDSFVKGPSVIDCGMFTQLGIWFGIRKMLGNKKFNQLFSNAPFYITQLNYSKVTDPKKPYLGNPLYPFFSDSKAEPDQVRVCHLENHSLYQKKHPGGNYGGENCLEFGGEYTIFDPSLEHTQCLTKHDVQSLLATAFNQEKDTNDEDRLEIYRKAAPDEKHPKLGITYKNLIAMADTFKDLEIKAADCGSEAASLYFDLAKFQGWVKAMAHDSLEDVTYVPEEKPSPSKTVLARIPIEHQATMDFAYFKANMTTPQQKELFTIAKKFCSDVVSERSTKVVLTGKAGIGKTASAVCCAKELESKGKKVVWVSEVMVKSWTEKANSIAEVEQCRTDIRKLLNGSTDAMVLDDDNLAGYAGKVLLEESYSWFISNPGRGLFITSNEELSFDTLYGLRLDQSYDCVPFPGYDSPQYINTILRSGLNGTSLRKTGFDRALLPVAEVKQLEALANLKLQKSAGIIVSSSAYKKGKKVFLKDSVEFIPGFKSLTPITISLKQKGILGEFYEKLSPLKKKWLVQFQVSENYTLDVEGNQILAPPFESIKVKSFVDTTSPVIAIELLEHEHWSGKKMINDTCFKQLMSVINFAHDKGGKRVVIINHTDNFCNKTLLEQIIKQVPESEKARTTDRLRLLLGL